MGGSKVQGHPWLKGDSRAPEHEEFCPPVPKYLNPRASAITENCKEQGSEVGSEWEGLRDAYFWVFREDGADRGLLLRSRQGGPLLTALPCFSFPLLWGRQESVGHLQAGRNAVLVAHG